MSASKRSTDAAPGVPTEQRVLGIDPGSRVAGYGLIATSATQRVRALEHGVWRLGASGVSLGERLLRLDRELGALIVRTRPDVIVIERMFVAEHAQAAIQLAHARGVVLLAAARSGVSISEYTASQVKRLIGSSGASSKSAVAQRLGWLLGVESFAAHDASDALGLALCHATQALGSATTGVAKRSGSIAEAVAHRLKPLR